MTLVVLKAAVALMPPPPAASTLSSGSPNVPPVAEKKSFSDEISTTPVALIVRLSGRVVVAEVLPSNSAKAPEAPRTAALVESECV